MKNGCDALMGATAWSPTLFVALALVSLASGCDDSARQSGQSRPRPSPQQTAPQPTEAASPKPPAPPLSDSTDRPEQPHPAGESPPRSQPFGPGAFVEEPNDGPVLEKSVGIVTEGRVFTPLIRAGQRLPFTCSRVFSNKTDGGSELFLEVAQQDPSGVENIVSTRVPIPPAPNGTLDITITLKIDEDKGMTVKATVAQSGVVKEFGPFPVE